MTYYKRCPGRHRDSHMEPASAFNVNMTAPDGLQAYCRACQRREKAERRERDKVLRKIRREEKTLRKRAPDLTAPSAGYSRQKWISTLRETGLKEWVCEHGVGHPDPASAQEVADRMAARYPDGGHTQQIWMIHGCDGCCSRDDFPGEEAC